jgi:NADPH:quinone reductase-like Zn-dependent oxidoreductase
MNYRSRPWLLLLVLLCSPIPSHASACSGLPATMRGILIDAPGGPESLRLETLPLPVPAPEEVLVRVAFAGVNPVDWKLQAAGRLPFPATPGGDFSGTVVGIGANVSGFACGDEVAGIVDQTARGGSYAEYVAAPAAAIVPRPGRYSLAQAAAYPTVTVAAWRFLIEAGQVRAGERVLIHGGAGGVGSMLVQLAKARGAHVIATASARNHAYLSELGADQTVDYRSERFEQVVAPVDLVIDTVGGDTLMRSPAVLRPGGRLLTLVGRVPPALCANGRIACPTPPPWDVARGLEYAAPLIEAGM